MRKPIIKLILLIISIFLILSATACANDPTPEEEAPYAVSISVDTNTIPENSAAGSVNLANINLMVMMSDGEIVTVPVTNEMVFTADRGDLNKIGTHHIRLIYAGMSTTFSITIQEAPLMNYTLTVHDGALQGREPIDGVWTGEFSEGERVSIVATDKSDEGLYFESWRINGQVHDRNASCDITINGNIIIVAHYELIKFKVSFNSNGGTSVAQMEAREIEQAPETTRDEYVFVGWAEDASKPNQLVTFPYTATRTIVLTAIWESLGLVYDKAPTALGYTITGYEYNGPRTSLVIPDFHEGFPIVKIARQAFAEATTLRTLKLNKYITEIEDYAFSECVNLQSFEKDPSGNPSVKDTFEVNNGVLYSDDALVAFPAGRMLINFDIERVSAIGTAAFNNANIGSINVKTTLLEIGGDAFNSRTIDNVIFHNAITPSMAFAENVFNENISRIYIVQNTYVDGYKEHTTFLPYVEKIEELVQSPQLGIYGNYLYRVITREIEGGSTPTIELIGSDRSLTTITIPITRIEGKEVTSIGRYAFSYCYNLEEVTVTQQSKLTRILEGAFDNTKWQEQPEHKYIKDGLIIINGILFRCLEDRTEYTIPYNVTTLGEECFSNKTKLEKVIFGVDDNDQRYIVAIDDGAFKNCINLKEIIIPKKVAKLGVSAFENTKLSSFGFEPESELKTVGNFCFRNASQLKSIDLGSAIEKIGRGVFNDCYSLESIAVNNSIDGSNDFFVTKSGVLFQKNKDLAGGIVDDFGRILHTYPAGRTAAVYQLPFEGLVGVTHINEFAFYYSNIAAVVLPPTVESIVSYAFVVPQLVYIEFTAEIELAVASYNILFSVFSPEHIIIKDTDSSNYGTWGAPEGVIKKKGAINTTNLVGLYDYDYQLEGTDRRDTFLYRFENGELYIIGSERTSARLSVPAYIEIDGTIHNIVGIEGYAFIGSMLKEIILPSTIETIKAYAFYYSYTLKELTSYKDTAPQLEYSEGSEPEEVLSFNPDTIIQNALLFVPAGFEANYVPWTTSIDFVIAIGSQPQILFDTNDGTAAVIIDTETGEPMDLSVLAVIPSAPVTQREGYTFVGWYDNEDFEGDPMVFPYEKHRNITFYARWGVRAFNITYDLSGGTFEETPVSTVNYGEGYNLTVPVKPGYVFDGWFDISQRQYSDGNGTGTGIGSPDHILNRTWGLTSDAMLIARFSPRQFTIAYDATGGTVGEPSATVIFNAAYTLEVPVRVGYTFQGWKDAQNRWLTYDNGVSTNVWSHTSDITVYAAWFALSYTVRFDDGQDTVFPEQSVTFGQPFTFPVPTKTGSVFFGWYDDWGGTGKQYTDQDGNSVRLWDKAGATIYMYAQWPKNISSVADFATVRETPEGSYILTNDITLTEEWTPIGVDSNSPFTGILDGNGYSVLGMSITSENSGYVGFVGYDQGTIRNL
ncbi:MAG: leucine-rich repeat protein, partial [Clostridia bacterium]|nr:leucine-rich repeat protein [Clostridia bacterium]